MRARIGVIDDHPAVRVGLATVLNSQPDMIVTAAASTARELVGLSRRVDAVVLDLMLADGSTPTDNVRVLSRLDCPVLVYTSGDRPALIREAARAGVAGMVRKSVLPPVIVAALRSVLRGEVAASSDWASAIDADRDQTRVRLSPREREVLELYASGETAERVAALLFISRETVLDHVRRIRTKYADADRAAPTKVSLYRRAVEDGILAAGDGALV